MQHQLTLHYVFTDRSTSACTAEAFNFNLLSNSISEEPCIWGSLKSMTRIASSSSQYKDLFEDEVTSLFINSDPTRVGSIAKGVDLYRIAERNDLRMSLNFSSMQPKEEFLLARKRVLITRAKSECSQSEQGGAK